MTTKKLHVILADDDNLISLTIKELLIRRGYRVSIALDGMEALEINAIDPADILVTDIQMPRLDGIGLTAELRKTRPTMPIVVLTAFNDKFPPSDKHLGILFKPILFELVELEIRRLLKSPHGMAA